MFSLTALLSATALNYLLSLVAIILFFVYYTHPASCSENKAFISVNMLLCVGASVMSILPKIQVSTHFYEAFNTLNFHKTECQILIYITSYFLCRNHNQDLACYNLQ